MPPNPGRPPQILTANQIAGAAQRAGFVPVGGLVDSQVVIMTAIALAESGGNMNALNNSGRDESYGLWQINMIGGLGPARRAQLLISSNEALYDPVINAGAALQIYKGQGLGAWSVYTSGAYRAHLPKAREGAANPAFDYPRGGPFNDPGPEGVDIQVGGKIPDILMDTFKPLLDWIGKEFLRIAMFIGGGVLIILGIIMYVKSQAMAPALHTLKKAVTP